MNLVYSLSSRLRILYAQSRRIMLITQVLPRLLAPVLAMTSFYAYPRFARIRIDFTVTLLRLR